MERLLTCRAKLSDSRHDDTKPAAFHAGCYVNSIKHLVQHSYIPFCLMPEAARLSSVMRALSGFHSYAIRIPVVYSMCDFL